jgi:hypothetical protein
MRGSVVVGAAVIGIAIGCAGSQVAGSYLVPKARADGTPTRWEYACFAAEPSAKFNDLGRQGWELVGWGDVPPVWCFKRPY